MHGKIEYEFITYYKNVYQTFRCYNNKTQEYFTNENLKFNLSNFYLPAKYESNDENLKIYSEELIKNNIPDLGFDFIEPFITKEHKICYRNTSENTVTFFKMHQSREFKLNYFEEIQPIENKWNEKCYNSAILYCKKGTFTSYGYDHKRFYQNCLKSEKFVFPYREGTPMNYKKIPTNIVLGYYRVKIHSENELFNIIFMYSKDDTYTSYSLKFCLKYQKHFNIKIELYSCENEPNAYVYTLKKSCITGDKVFTVWSDRIDYLKEKYPNNCFIKMLSSSLHGGLCKKLKYHKTYEQMVDMEKTGLSVGVTNNNDYIIVDEIETDNALLFKLVNPKRKFLYNIARLQSFLADFCRVKMMEIIIAEDLKHDEIIRIHTDGIATTRPINKKYENLIIEEKTTGSMIFTTINKLPVRLTI